MCGVLGPSPPYASMAFIAAWIRDRRDVCALRTREIALGVEVEIFPAMVGTVLWLPVHQSKMNRNPENHADHGPCIQIP